MHEAISKAAAFLGMLGHDVEAAYAFYRQHRDEIDSVIADVTALISALTAR